MVFVTERGSSFYVYARRSDDEPAWIVNSVGNWKHGRKSLSALFGTTQWQKTNSFMYTRSPSVASIRLAADRLLASGRDFNLPSACRTLHVDFFGSVTDVTTGRALYST